MSPHHCQPAFTIVIDAPRGFVELTLRGFWSLGTCADFERTLRVMLPLLPLGGCPLRSQVTLFDMTDFSVQQQSTLMALGAMALDQDTGSRRIAIVTRSELVKQQARRVAPDYAIYTDRRAAITWLLEEAKAAA